MQRIIAALQGLVEKSKKDRKVNRVKRAVEAARDNAQDEIERLEESKIKVVEELAGETEVNIIIGELSDIIGKQEEQQAIIDRLNKVQAYLNEDVEVVEKG